MIAKNYGDIVTTTFPSKNVLYIDNMDLPTQVLTQSHFEHIEVIYNIENLTK